MKLRGERWKDRRVGREGGGWPDGCELPRSPAISRLSRRGFPACEIGDSRSKSVGEVLRDWSVSAIEARRASIPAISRDLPSIPAISSDLPSIPAISRDLPSIPSISRDLPSMPASSRDLPSMPASFPPRCCSPIPASLPARCRSSSDPIGCSSAECGCCGIRPSASPAPGPPPRSAPPAALIWQPSADPPALKWQLGRPPPTAPLCSAPPDLWSPFAEAGEGLPY